MEIGYDLSRLFQRLNIQAGKRQNFGNGGREKKMVLRDIFSNFLKKIVPIPPHRTRFKNNGSTLIRIE